MSQNAPSSIDVQEIQFKLHRKLNVFKPPGEIKSLVHLLAVAPSKGLLFAANPYELEFKVFKLSELNSEGSEVKVRAVPLISQTLALACSCDGSMLAVSYVFNKTGFLQIFQVDSFLSPDVNALYTMPIAPEYNVYTSQLLWNPVISNNLALILTDGSVGMFALNAGGQYDKITLNKEHQVTCGCWSPKGKQIVLGLGTGNLQQYKPNLTPARIIHSPVGLQQQPYDIIAVHWLSTFQFAAILVSKSNETLPCLYIINAPKTGQPIFINYYDICYSGPGPRQQQFTFTHILSWNLLLVTSANGVEVGVLGTKETGENPTWLQYTLLDEARIEMPLTDAKDETYPMGFALDTSCSHQLILGEKKLPVMPIIHVLTTYGQLISFNFLNLMNGAQNICSPPPPIMDASGQFINLTPAIVGGTNGEVVASVAGNLTAVSTASHQGGAGLKDVTFSMHSSNMVTSTPAPKEKNNALFNNNNNNNNTTNITVKPSAAAAAVAVSVTTTSTVFNVPGNTALTVASKVTGFASTSATTANIFSENNQKNASNSNIINIGKLSAVATSSAGVADSKPLYTVPPTYTPPTPPLPRDQQQKISTTEAATVNENMAAHQTPLDAYQVDEIVKHMLKLQIEAFDRELKQLKHQSDAMINNLGNRDEVKVCSKQLNDLHEIIDQARDHEFDTDLQVLCASIDESYIVLRECLAKLEIRENAAYGRLKCTPLSDVANRRQLDKLRINLLANENDMKQVHQMLEQQWSEYQDVVRRNSKHEMHMPCLGGVYQKMSKIKNLLAVHRQKLQHIKNKLKESGILYKPPNEPNVNRKAANALMRSNKAMDTLTDSMLTMSLAQMVSRSRAQLTAKKLQAIRNFTKQQKQINVIRPKRPDRVGLKSEIILEIKMQTDQKQKQEKVKKVDTNKMELNFKQQQQQQQQHVSVKPHGKLAAHSSNLTKPQASKATPATMSANMFNTPSVASSANTNLNISSSSSFVKTSSGAMNDQILMKTPLANSTPFAGFTAGGSAPFNFSHQPNKSTHKDAAPTPVSFNAKVLQSNEMKISATATTSASAKTTGHQNVTNKMNGVIVNGKQQQPQESNQPVTFTKVGGSAAATTTTTPLSFQLSKSTSYATLAPASAAASTVAAFNFNGSTNRTKQAGAGTKSMTTTTSLANFAPSPSATFGNVANGNKSGGGGPTSSFFTPASSAANAQTKTAANATTTIMSTKTTMKPIDLTTSLDFSGAEIELGSLTICKPTTKENDGNAKSVKSTTAPTTTSTAAVPSPFSFISAAAENGGQGKSIFGASISSTAGTPASSAFSFSIAAAGAHNTTAATTTTSITNSTAAPLSTATTATSAFNSVTTTASVAPLFGALNLTAAATGTPTTTAHTATSGNNIFGGASNIFSTTTTTTTTATTSTFGQSTNIFGGGSGAGGGTTVPTTSANIFKGIPKPDQSIFGGDGDRGSDCVANTAPASNAANVPSGLFAAAAVSTKPSTNGGENIFGGGGGGGGGKAAFNSPLGTGGGSIFGGSNTTPAAAGPFVSAAGGSLFGNQANSPTESGNIFTSAAQPQQQANAAGSGSLFGKGMFGQSTSANIFGGQAQAAAATGGGFGGSPAGAASSIFGGGSAVSGGSLFGGSAASPPAFGSTSSNFGSFSQPAAGSSAFGCATGFAQGGTTSVQQSGFGSSTQQPSSAFAKPVFGGTPAFGSPTPAFGAQPTFGGGPTFGSPKGFGSFAASTGSATGPSAGAAAAAAGVGGGLGFGGVTPAATKNNIFETLGSSDSGLSFGNLAQTTQQPAPPKPTFGGSSFMNYRS